MRGISHAPEPPISGNNRDLMRPSGSSIGADMGGVVTSMDRTYDAVMDKLRDSAPQVGMAMGVIFFVVGLVLANFGIVGLGVVVTLAGFFSRPAKN